MSKTSHSRFIFLVGGLVLLAVAAVLPVEKVVGKALSPARMAQIEAASGSARVEQLHTQFRQGLQWFRGGAAVLGLWCVVLGLLWNCLRRWAAIGDDGVQDVVATERHEMWFPLAWCLLVMAMGVPLLTKGFDNLETVNLQMLAERGPLVTMACQNLPPRAAQIGYTAIESLSVKALGSSEVSARLPALVFGALAMFPLYFLGRRYGSRITANLMCASLAVTGFYHFANTYARGYAMASTAFLACVWLAAGLRQSTWSRWVWLGVCMVTACYAHMASGVYVAVLCLVVVTNQLVLGWRSDRARGAAVQMVKPLVVFGTCVWVLAFLYAITIPSTMSYRSSFSLQDYYISYHINAQLARAMAQSWAWVRDVNGVEWIQVGLFLVGLVVGLKRRMKTTLCLVLPAVVAVGIFWWGGLYIFTRYFIQFLPAYALLSVLPIAVLMERFRRPVVLRAVLGAFFVLASMAGVLTMKRLLRLERQGIRAALQEFHDVKQEGDRFMVALDPYVTARRYYPDVVSGYRGREFMAEMKAEKPPEFVLSVPYLEMDIPGAEALLAEKYELHRAYPSWCDAELVIDAVSLYKLKK